MCATVLNIFSKKIISSCVFKAWYWPCVWMFRLALSGHIYFLYFETPILTLCLLASRNTWCSSACFGTQVSSKYGTWYSERVILQFMCAGCWAGVTYFRYAVLTNRNQDETAVHCCDTALSVLVMLVSRNVFSCSISLAVYYLYTFLWLIRSLVDPTLAVFIVCGPLQFVLLISSNTKLRKRILNFVWSTWKYWWNETDDEISPVFAHIHGTLKFIFSHCFRCYLRQLLLYENVNRLQNT